MFYFLLIYIFVEFKRVKAGILCVLFLAVSPTLKNSAWLYCRIGVFYFVFVF